MTREGPARDAAFGAFVRMHQDRLYRFIRRYVGDSEEAYDILQETFVSAWKALPGYDADRPASTWLRRIALNKCRDWARRRAVRRFFYTAATLDDAPAAALQAVDRSGSEDQALARLDAAIAALPSSLKEPLLLTAFEGLSQQQAADALGLTAKAIENKVARARKMLSHALSLDAIEDH